MHVGDRVVPVLGGSHEGRARGDSSLLSWCPGWRLLRKCVLRWSSCSTPGALCAPGELPPLGLESWGAGWLWGTVGHDGRILASGRSDHRAGGTREDLWAFAGGSQSISCWLQSREQVQDTKRVAFPGLRVDRWLVKCEEEATGLAGLACSRAASQPACSSAFSSSSALSSLLSWPLPQAWCPGQDSRA